MSSQAPALNTEQMDALRRVWNRRSELDQATRVQVEQLARQNGLVSMGESMGIGPMQAQMPEPTFPERFLQETRSTLGAAAPFTVDPLVGAAKGAGSTAFGLQNIIGGLLGNEQPEKPDFLGPQTTGERVGFTAEQIGEFFVPGMAASRAPRVGAAIARPGLAGVAANTAVEGLGSAGVSFAQSGGNPITSLIDGGIDAAFTAAFGGAGALFRRGGGRAMTSAIAPSATDFKHGFDANNIFKYDLQGTIPQMVKNTKAKLDELGGELAAAIQRHGNTQVDAVDLLQDAYQEVLNQGAKNFGKLSDLDTALGKFMDELQAIAPSGQLGLVELQKLKQAVGEMGAWAEGLTTLDLRAVEALSNAYYSKLREGIEIAAPEVRRINNQLSEVIPINSALIRRLPQFEKRRLFELSEIIVLAGGAGFLMGGGGFASTATGTSGLLLLSRMTHSATGGRIFNALAPVTPQAGPIVGRTAAGITGAPILEEDSPEP